MGGGGWAGMVGGPSRAPVAACGWYVAVAWLAPDGGAAGPRAGAWSVVRNGSSALGAGIDHHPSSRRGVGGDVWPPCDLSGRPEVRRKTALSRGELPSAMGSAGVRSVFLAGYRTGTRARR